MVPTSINCHDVRLLEINGRYPIRVKCLHTLIKFSLIIPYRLIKWWISAPRQVPQEIVHLQASVPVWNTFPPANAPKTGAAEFNVWDNTVLLAWRRLLLTRGVPRARPLNWRGTQSLVHRSLCGIIMKYCINILNGRATSVQDIWKRAGRLWHTLHWFHTKLTRIQSPEFIYGMWFQNDFFFLSFLCFWKLFILSKRDMIFFLLILSHF